MEKMGEQFIFIHHFIGVSDLKAASFLIRTTTDVAILKLTRRRSNFPAAVTKHHIQDNLQKKEFIGGLRVQRVRSWPSLWGA